MTRIRASAPVAWAGWSRQLIWRLAALWLVVLAMGLGVIGIVLAIVQSRSLSVQLIAPAEAHARYIAEAALLQFDRDIALGIDALASHVRSGGNAEWVPGSGFPGWIDGLYARVGTRLLTVAPASERSPELARMVEDELAARAGMPVEGPERKVELVYKPIAGAPVVLAFAKATAPDGRVVMLAAHVNLDRLKSQLVMPLLSSGTGLELVAAADQSRPSPWSQRLFSAMRFWKIRPTEAFILEQRRAVLGQTLVYLGLTVLALATLLVAMWVLVRVVRREMALTEMKANFVADVSHELKTPLALIRMFGETLQSGRVIAEDKRREYYEIITRESTRLTNLINNILDFARIEAGRKEYTLRPTNVGDVVRHTYEAYRPQLEHHGFEHHFAAAPSLPLVNADADAISQALINLIHNAIKYSGEERYLSIDIGEDVRRGRRGVLISVHDRGIGIRPEDRAHLFDGFFRAQDARVRGQGGTGLGLALVKHIVEAHHGSVDVESRLVKGSTFRVFLPASEGQGDRRDVLTQDGLADAATRSPQ